MANILEKAACLGTWLAQAFQKKSKQEHMDYHPSVAKVKRHLEQAADTER